MHQRRWVTEAEGTFLHFLSVWVVVMFPHSSRVVAQFVLSQSIKLHLVVSWSTNFEQYPFQMHHKALRYMQKRLTDIPAKTAFVSTNLETGRWHGIDLRLV